MRRLLPALPLLTLIVAATAPPAPADDKKPEARAPERPGIEVCFVLDTTGSMSGLIEGAKRKIWAITNDLVSVKPAPQIRLGLIGYRDRGDAYITKTFDLSDDIDAVYGHLMRFKADGGGDNPESVNQALNEAVTKMTWSKDKKVLKVIFLVGDAPPHMDYDGDIPYTATCQSAVKRDLIINTIQCGEQAATRPVWRKIAQLAEGSFVSIGQTGDMVATATPYDEELAKLTEQLNGTVIPYGSARVRRGVERKLDLSSRAPATSGADRAAALSKTDSGAVTGRGDLVKDLEDDKARLEDLNENELPDELRQLKPEERTKYIDQKREQRDELEKQIAALVKRRDAHILAERKKLAQEGKKDAFDEQVSKMIRQQAKRKGIEYEE